MDAEQSHVEDNSEAAAVGIDGKQSLVRKRQSDTPTVIDTDMVPLPMILLPLLTSPLPTVNTSDDMADGNDADCQLFDQPVELRFHQLL